MPEHEYVERFLSALQSQKGFSNNTLSAYRNDLTQFGEYLSTGEGAALEPVNDWKDVTPDNIMSFVLHLKERGYSQTTVARKLAAIKSFYKYLTANSVVSANPAEELASPHVDRSLPQTVSSSEVEVLMARINAAGDTPEGLRDRAMMQLLYSSGLRAGEMVALNLGDLNMEEGTVDVAAGRGKSRHIKLAPGGALDALHDYLERGRPSLARAERGANLAGEEGAEALFLNHRGQRLTRQGFWLILKAYARSAGLGDITPHILRHSFAAQTLKGGTDIKDLQQILGHANVSTTQIYTRIEEGGKRSSRRGESRRGQKKAG